MQDKVSKIVIHDWLLPRSAGLQSEGLSNPGFKIYMHIGYALRAHIHDANKRGRQSHMAKTKVLYLKCATGQIVLSLTIQRCCLANNASK